jgi:hypothetical protein
MGQAADAERLRLLSRTTTNRLREAFHDIWRIGAQGIGKMPDLPLDSPLGTRRLT